MRHLLFSLLLLSVACLAEDPSAGGEVGPDAGLTDASGEEEEQGVALQVDGFPPQTYWESVPVYGRGPANGTVLVEGNIDTVSRELNPDGSFCLDVPLEKGALNVVELVAINEHGERSEIQVFEVSQSGEPPEANQPVAAQNTVLGALPTTDSTVNELVGEFAAMTDGDLDSSVVVENGVIGRDRFILRAPVPGGIDTIRVYSNPDCLAGDYLVHTAPSIYPNMPKPGKRDEDDGPWTFRGHYHADGTSVNVTDCSQNSLSCQEFSFNAAVAEAIAVVFSDHSCDKGLFSLGEYQIHEVEAWSPQGVAPPSVVAPSCQGGF